MDKNEQKKAAPMNNELIAAKKAEAAAKERAEKAEAEAAKQKQAAEEAKAKAKEIQQRFEAYAKIKAQTITDLIAQLSKEGDKPSTRVIRDENGNPIGIEGGAFHQRPILDRYGHPTGAVAVGRNEKELKKDEDDYWEFIMANGKDHISAILNLNAAEEYVGAGYTAKGLATITAKNGSDWIVDEEGQCARDALNPSSKISSPLKTKLSLEDLCALFADKLGGKQKKD